MLPLHYSHLGAPTEIRTLTACLEGRNATVTSLVLVRAVGFEPTSVSLKGSCNPILLRPLVALTGFEPAPSCLKDRRPSNSLQRLEPREGFEPSFPPYQGGGLPLTYLGLFIWLVKWSNGVMSRLLYLDLYLSS